MKQMRNIGLLFLTSVLLAGLFGCAAPSSHLQQSALTRTEAGAISDRLSAAIEQRYPLLQHKRVNRYVDALGQYIVSRNTKMPPLPYEFRVLRTNELLTFSTPSGVVYVSLGMLRACTMEGQFVAALSHELAHQRLGHGVQVWRDRLQTWRTAEENPAQQQRNWTDKLYGKNGLMYYGEGMEREADQVALAILYNAGYDPRVMLSFLEILKKKESETPKDVAGLLSTHPASLQRINWTKTEVLKLPPIKDAKLDSHTFADLRSLFQRAETQAKKGGTDGSAENPEDGPTKP